MGFIKKAIVSCLGCISFLLAADGEQLDGQEAGRALDEVVRAFEKKMEGKFGLVCCKGGGSMPYDIQRIDIGFETPKSASLDEARKVGVFFMEQFLSMINSDEKVRPYLREYPFTSKRVFMTLSFRQQSGKELYVSLVKNEIVYKTCDGPLSKFVEILREPYEEAVKMVRKK